MRCKSAIRFAAPAVLTAMILALGACGDRGPLEILGGGIPPPDEFQVLPHKPLVIPSSMALPEPRPGAPSPRDPDPHRDALQALMGTSGSPTVENMPPTAGEEVLLSSANAAAASDNIRVQLEQDKVKAETDKPYEPPTVAELLGFSKGEKLDEKELLDPIAESQRLQREGFVAPADPDAEAAKEEPRTRAEPTESYRRPPSPIVHEGTGPAY